MSTDIARIITSVAELEPALGFYRDILGLDLAARANGFAWLTAGGTEVMLHEREASPSDSGVAIGFRVDDAAVTVSLWQEWGGIIVDLPAEQPWGELMAVVRDPDGHLVCVSSR